MTGPEQRLREALEARAASVTYKDLRPPLPPSAGGPLVRMLRRGVKAAGLLGLAAALAAVMLMLSDAPERSPAQVPAPSRTPAPHRPSATPGTSAAPTPSPDVPRPEGPEPRAG
ncbi:hypothetical protein GCM10010095_75430 [Streptomyces anthocyanicus]|uniref:hypothetical protein n=1 Tax=Streptomyces anthocyanicus TaxID=68174 RepID=UPI0016707219|nr:hypothetical protein [Streptomyces anthocyanicus]GGL79314.1 hypothetical protein GCM10010095_75430 [Streptomyces anthocyanicus]